MTQVYERKRRMKPTCQQPPQKLRCLSGYNCFTSEFLKSEGICYMHVKSVRQCSPM